MTSRSRICFKLAAALLVNALIAAAGPVSGRIELRDSKDAAVRKGNYSGVVVWLEPVNAPPFVPTGGRATLDQRNKTFVPHVLAIETGTMVNFPNSDPIFHNAFSNYNGQLFDVGLYPPGTSRSVRFNRAGVVRVFCNIHASMSAVIVVVNTPYYAVTDHDGTFRIPNVPVGPYTVKMFHERATQKTLDAISRMIQVENGPVVLPTTGISESGYLEVPHTNKFGHDYHDPPDDHGFYPSVKK